MLRPTLSIAASIVVATVALPSSAATVELGEEEFRLYCGYLDASTDPAMAKLKPAARDEKIAKKAKVKPKVLQDAVAKGEAAGPSCDAIAKRVDSDVKAALDTALAGRISFYELDASDPTHVVVRVAWLGIDKKKLLEEASLVAATVIKEAPMVKTLALRGVDPSAADKNADEAGWFDAKISGLNARRIDVPKIWEYATTRYRRLFDGIVER
jgi:hypothetical protein